MATPATINPIAGALGSGLGALLGSAFGSGAAPTNPYWSGIQTGADSLGSLGATTSTAGTGLLNTGTSLTPNTLQQYAQYQNALTANPYTSNFDAARTAGAAGQARQNQAAGDAQLTSSLAARGLAQPGGPSSPYAGALTAEQQTSTGAMDAAQNQYAANSIQQQLQNQGLAAQSAAQEQSGFVGQGNQTVQNGANIQNLSLEQLQQLAQQYQQAMQAQAQQSQGLGAGLGGIATGVLGGILPATGL